MNIYPVSTRKHSSRMRTARLLIGKGVLSRGGCCPEGMWGWCCPGGRGCGAVWEMVLSRGWWCCLGVAVQGGGAVQEGDGGVVQGVVLFGWEGVVLSITGIDIITPPSPVNRMTDRSRNITLPQTLFAGGKNSRIRCQFRG